MLPVIRQKCRTAFYLSSDQQVRVIIAVKRGTRSPLNISPADNIKPSTSLCLKMNPIKRTMTNTIPQSQSILAIRAGVDSTESSTQTSVETIHKYLTSGVRSRLALFAAKEAVDAPLCLDYARLEDPPSDEIYHWWPSSSTAIESYCTPSFDKIPVFVLDRNLCHRLRCYYRVAMGRHHLQGGIQNPGFVPRRLGDRC